MHILGILLKRLKGGCEISQMNAIDWIARILVIIGALNWGLMIWGINVVGNLGVVTTIIYALVGLAGIWEIIRLL